MVRLLPAYARDVLSFLRYGTLQECRLVSRSLNNLIATSFFPARRRLGLLDISVGGLNDLGRPYWSKPTITEDGYVNTWRQCARDWKQVQEEWGCCRDEFQSEAMSLVGKCIFPSHPADCFAEFLINLRLSPFDYPFSHTITLFARNVMTVETAFGVLHMLDHLRDVTFEQHWMRTWRGHNSLLLNPSIIRLLSLGKRGCKLCVAVYQRNGPDYVPRTSESLKACISHVNIGELEWRFTDLSEVSNFALTGRRFCKLLRLTQPANSDFDSILEHFQSTLPTIGRDVVSELALSRIHWTNGVPYDGFWPGRLPPKRRMERLGYDRVEKVLIYRHRGLANANSGETFDVVVSCGLSPDLRETLAEMRLIFRV